MNTALELGTSWGFVWGAKAPVGRLIGNIGSEVNVFAKALRQRSLTKFPGQSEKLRECRNLPRRPLDLKTQLGENDDGILQGTLYGHVYGPLPCLKGCELRSLF